MPLYEFPFFRCTGSCDGRCCRSALKWLSWLPLRCPGFHESVTYHGVATRTARCDDLLWGGHAPYIITLVSSSADYRATGMIPSKHL